mmetsp:Transcript_1908/g.6839  ORF Transcript_1908/g.6839 Transcript_1908/m.6839 type:complete len:137 (+) Transcript_1908:392-802(+)
MKLGATMALAAGPVGRAAEGATNIKLGKKEAEESRVTSAFTYGYTKGLFGGAGLQGQFVMSRAKGTAKYYKLDNLDQITDDLPEAADATKEEPAPTASKAPAKINVVDILYGKTAAVHTPATQKLVDAVQKAAAGY